MTDEERIALAKSIQRSLKTLRAAIDSMEAKIIEIVGEGSAKIPELDVNDEPTWNYAVKQRIPENIYLTLEFGAYAIKHGFTLEQAEVMFNGTPPGAPKNYNGFKRHFLQSGKKYERWTLVWQRWVRDTREHQAKKANGGGSRSDSKVANYR
jgi:hypothetical protein